MTTASAELLSRLARPEVRDLPAYNAGLSSDVVRQRYGVTHVARLASNENPFGPSPAVAKALAELAGAAATYPDANSQALRSAIAERTGTQAGQVVMGNGSENLLEVLCQAFLSPGDRVVTLSPSFGLHDIYPRMMGARVQMVPVTPALEFDVDAWCDALAGGPQPPKLAMLSNPSNPVGCMLDAHAFRRIVQATPPETLLVIDEAYYEYARLTPGFPDALAELRAQSRPWIALRTFSKAWGLAGLRVGYGIASDEKLVQILDRVRTPFNVNLAAQTAALAAWKDPAHMEMSVRETVARRDALAAQLHALGVTMAPSAANFLFLNLQRANGPVAEGLLARGVAVKPWKERGYENFIRVSIGSAEDNALFLQAFTDVMGLAS
ncbi:histidinol-phosphate transaminase [Polaromonas jejuensis]|uniref:Histidinol-phosphate aminotransferase n=1 Tax=Polaromonas jejuensis TaxID=457502 RepID=A0ABW0Q8Z9_9BURK|nr:histidinol-phosphate transaminase [Polaromonas jejuensis]